jgi:hypothetical protein
MKKSELLGLGVPEAAIREIQRIHGEEVTKAQRVAFEPTRRENDRMREAIAALLPMLKTPRSLNAVLNTANYQYYFERRPKPEKPGETPGNAADCAELFTTEEIPIKALAEQENEPAMAE